MGLRLKFNIVIVVACLAGMALATLLSWQATRRHALAAIEQEITLIRGHALAVRSYTSTGILPLVREHQNFLFVPNSVPSFAAQSVFARFQEKFPDYYYKEATLNPTNPDDLAEPWEAELIEALRNDPTRDHIDVEISRPEGKFYAVAFPLRVSSQSCLTCHSSPEAAPAAMVDIYGRDHGFGWQMDEVIGAQIVSVPMAVADSRAREMVIVLAGGLGVALLLVLIVMNLLLGRIVLRPVLAMSAIAERVSLGDVSAPEYVRKGKDEISSLSRSFNRMRRSLDSALKLLDE
jgi:HAMP domain-containing protein